MIAPRLDGRDAVEDAQIDERVRLGGLHQGALDVVLLEVDEGRHGMAVLRQQVEGEHLAIAVVGAPDLPAHAPGERRVRDAQPVHDLERALGPADRARAAGHAVVVVQHRRRDPARGQVEREREPDRPRAHDDGAMARLRRVEAGGRGVAEAGGVGGHGARRTPLRRDGRRRSRVGHGGQDGAVHRRSQGPRPAQAGRGAGARVSRCGGRAPWRSARPGAAIAPVPPRRAPLPA